MQVPRRSLFVSLFLGIFAVLVAAIKAIFDVTIQDYWKDTVSPLLKAHIGPWSTTMLDWIGPFWLGVLLTLGLMFAVELVFSSKINNRFSNIEDNKNDNGVTKKQLASFKSAYAHNVDLGERISGIKSSTRTAIMAFEHANVIWLWESYTFYFVPQSMNEKVTLLVDINIRNSVGLYDRKALAAEFSPPFGLHPPMGGIARLWRQNRTRWGWIGWLEWSRQYEAGGCFYQKFSNGILIGPLPVDDAASAWDIYSILDTGEYRLTRTEIRANNEFIALDQLVSTS